MYISVIGSPGCGKTTLFGVLSGTAADGKPGAETLAVIDVPDNRIDELSRIFKPRKSIYSRITLADTIAIEEGDMKDDRVSAKTIQQMRQSDAFLLVLRKFDNGTPIRVKDEFLTIFQEFIISDMVQIESRLERIRKQGARKDNTPLAREEQLLNQCLAHLSREEPLSTAPVSERDGKQLNSFQFLSSKPLMVVINCSEEEFGDADRAVSELKETIPSYIPVLAACGKLEAEVALMAPEEQGTFMGAYGIKESVKGRIVRLASETLGLISFLTVGQDECRAWPVKRGTTAQEAAATIHTDLSQRFIRAETVSYDDFISNGGFAECKKKGLWRLEGKNYIVQDGDILTIRAGN
jgi:GTP-binding protein YchF